MDQDGAPQLEPDNEARRAARAAVFIGAGLRRQGGTGVNVEVLDLSTTGFRVAAHFRAPVGTYVWLKLPGLDSLDAKVAWSDGVHLGCRFIAPLHPSIVERFAHLNPPAKTD